MTRQEFKSLGCCRALDNPGLGPFGQPRVKGPDHGGEEGALVPEIQIEGAFRNASAACYGGDFRAVKAVRDEFFVRGSDDSLLLGLEALPACLVGRFRHVWHSASKMSLTHLY